VNKRELNEKIKIKQIEFILKFPLYGSYFVGVSFVFNKKSFKIVNFFSYHYFIVKLIYIKKYYRSYYVKSLMSNLL
jgi:hypothetical protein